MKFPSLQHCIFAEAGQSVFRILDGNEGMDLPLERQESGRLTAACKERIAAALRQMLKRRTLRIGQQIWCALGARGVSLRRFTVPVAPEEELRRVLALQIETEFPLPADQLAWGFYRLPSSGAGSQAAGQRVIVAAVKIDAVQEYAQLFSDCGLAPTFTLSALARCATCPAAPESYYLLDIGRHGSELSTVEGGILLNARVVPWGEADFTTLIQKQLETSPEEAERILLSGAGGTHDSRAGQIQACMNAAASALAALLPGELDGRKLYISGRISQSALLGNALRGLLGSGLQLERVDLPDGPGRSAATIGLERLGTGARANLPLVLRAKEDARQGTVDAPSAWRWAGAGALVLLALFSLRYGEALLCKRTLEQRLVEVQQYRKGLPQIDRELALFHFLETNGPPMLDALYTLAETAPRGLRFESLATSRRGDVSLRGVFGNPEQGAEFRGKLVGTGFFSSVVFDEQTPSPDRQRVTFRLSAQWKAAGRPAVSPQIPNEKSQTAAGRDPSKQAVGAAPAAAKISTHAPPH